MFSDNKFSVGLIAFLCGLLFGLGLIISGMANPAKVLNFLDILGHWDPSLAFVMGGAVSVTVLGYPMLRRKDRPMLVAKFQWPTRTDIDRNLLLGAVLFGMGWGIAGYCPGPAWVALSALAPGTLVFLVAMLLGMFVTTLWKKHTS